MEISSLKRGGNIYISLFANIAKSIVVENQISCQTILTKCEKGDISSKIIQLGFTNDNCLYHHALYDLF